MSILAWIIFGLLAGIVAKLLTPGRDPGGCIVTMLLGIGGSFIGGFLFKWLADRPNVTQFDFRSFAVAVVGAIVVLLLYRLIAGSRA